MSFLRPLAGLVSALVVVLFATATLAADLQSLVTNLTTGGFGDRETAIGALAASGDPRAAPILEAMGAGNLYVRPSDKTVVIGNPDGKQLVLEDAITGKPAGTATEAELERVRVNNRLRGLIEETVGSLTLMSPDARVRREAAESLFKRPNPAALGALDAAIAAEKDGRVKAAFGEARAALILASPDEPKDKKIEALAVVRDRGDREALGVLQAAANNATDPDVKAAANAAAGTVRQSLATWEAAQNVWYGISLGSVLLLAAIGLAITFGTMGVINMAHGEMVMLGAYTTFVVQEIIRTRAPQLFDASLVIALPLAFLVAGVVGIAIERSIIRFLYGRPLDTLLATWGLSLVLQQAVRSIFGPSNREVGAPSWMSGTFQVGQLNVTYGRLWIVVFALAVFATLMLLLRKTPLGLYMRAVTQNRPMASAMGIRTPRVDALTFGLGSGIAGLAGVALSQIDNVSPNLGQGYIIDSFMVVVFGGVGNLFGTLVGATALGIVNKFLEPYAGAVLGKILVLVFIILFIQRRPRGLFALKGRSVE
ncbi:MAG: urea ABC transporter permease subunit UrtB [Alphaproteobacteria bacterium]|nr:urea ABC transporter permease subunit UrtB [Alphaproteobacteria bacterium]